MPRRQRIASGGMIFHVLDRAADAGNLGREQRVEIFDIDSGEVVSVQQVSNFANGKYLKWNVSGHVAVRITATKGPNAVVSGAFVKAAT